MWSAIGVPGPGSVGVPDALAGIVLDPFRTPSRTHSPGSSWAPFRTPSRTLPRVTPDTPAHHAAGPSRLSSRNSRISRSIRAWYAA